MNRGLPPACCPAHQQLHVHSIEGGKGYIQCLAASCPRLSRYKLRRLPRGPGDKAKQNYNKVCNVIGHFVLASQSLLGHCTFIMEIVSQQMSFLARKMTNVITSRLFFIALLRAATLFTQGYCSLQVGWKSASCKLQSLSKQFH